jgi:hypothetical protein
VAKGKYEPMHPEKYLGDWRKIRFLSSWELKFMQFLDVNPNVIAWGSEEFQIPYWNPVKKKICAYYPDFIVKFKNDKGEVVTEVIEIKPRVQSVLPKGKKISLYDQVQLVLNHAKWTAAESFCKSRGINFKVLNEQNLFRQKK